MNFLLVKTKDLSLELKIVLLLVGLLCVVITFIAILFYKKKIQKEKNDRDQFKIIETQLKYKIFYFWGHIAYVLVIFTAVVAAIVLLAVSIGSFA